MNNLKPIVAVIFAGFICVSAYSQRAFAQIYASMNFNQYVLANGQRTSPAEQVTGTAVPIQKTATASIGDGGNATATYNVTDNGSVAVLDISASGSITPADYGAEEGSFNNGTIFTFTVPVKYAVTLSESGSGVLSFELGGGIEPVEAAFSDSTKVYAGTIDPRDGEMVMTENWDLSQGGIPGSQSGSDSIAMTFTPINPVPEPSSAMLIVLPAIALLTRRPRKACGCGAWCG